MKKCERCQQPSSCFKMSWFVPQMLCTICQEYESLHPMLPYAREVERRETNKKNLNFSGIGLPLDLSNLYPTPTKKIKTLTKTACESIVYLVDHIYENSN